MTPSNNNDTASESIADSELESTESVNNGLAEQESKNSGFMANTIGRLKKKDRETSSSPNVEEDDNSSKKKNKLMLGKKILGSLGDL